MNWVLVIWSMVTGVCLSVAVIHINIWVRDRRSWENFWFSVMALSVIGLVVGEVMTMFANSPAEYGRAFRWSHLVNGIVVLASLSFVQLYFGTGRPWLFALALVMRFLAIIANFTTGLNLHILSIERLDQISFLGQQVSILGEWTANPWVILGQLAASVQVVFVLDASIRLWKLNSYDSRRRAVIFGGTLFFFTLYASAHAGLASAGLLRTPIIVSLPFLAVILAMAFQMSGDLHRVVQIGRDLQESEQQLAMAAEAANLGIWIGDVKSNEIWASDNWRDLFGYAKSGVLGLQALVQRVHPDDRPSFHETLSRALASTGNYVSEYRLLLPDGKVRWIASHGRVLCGSDGNPAQIRGVSIDISERRRLELERQELKDELAHAGRVTMLGQLASSLAHELGQPLGAILRNAEAAELLLQDPNPNLDELRDIVSDICNDDHRASQVIDRLRSLLKRNKVELLPIELGPLLNDVVSLVNFDALARRVSLSTSIAPGMPTVRGDRVHLQQVMLNLIINAMDAIDAGNSQERRIILEARRRNDGMIEVAVSDSGPGISKGVASDIFQPFVTTKSSGMGMGLAISKTIIEALGGEIWTENRPGFGATFLFTLCVVEEP